MAAQSAKGHIIGDRTSMPALFPEIYALDRSRHFPVTSLEKRDSVAMAAISAAANLSQPSRTPKEICAATTTAEMSIGPMSRGGILNFCIIRLLLLLSVCCWF